MIKISIATAQSASEHKMTVFMANHSLKTGGYIPAGKRAIWNKSGQLIAELNGSEEAIIMLQKKLIKGNVK